MNIYVQKNISSLSKIGQTVAHFLKSGKPVQVGYTTKHEREIIMRFQKRLDALYHEEVEYTYPPTGYVTYLSDKMVVSETKDESIKATFMLSYDPIHIKSIYTFVSDMISDITGMIPQKKEKERW
jgi:heat shock protein HspQ